MLIKPRYTFKDLSLWTRWETLGFTVYNLAITGLYSLLGLTFLHLPWAPITIIGTAVAFIVSFQNNAAYGRIWEARQIWGGIVNTSRTWGVRVIHLVNAEYASAAPAAADIEAHRKVLIYRHIAWLTALRHAMRQIKPWEVYGHSKSNREWAEQMCIPEQQSTLEADLTPYLSPEEKREVLSRTNKAAAVLNLQARHLQTLKGTGLLWEFSLLEMHGLLTECLTLQGQSERIKNFPYPKQYASLSYYFVRIFILLLPFGAIPEFMDISQNLSAQHPLFSPYFVWLSVPFCVLASWVFYTMERIGRAGENPFEGTPNDVPISTLSRGIEIDLREMLGEHPEQIPKAYPALHDVQM
jgi:ion channel-forming bestrophin family protein